MLYSLNILVTTDMYHLSKLVVIRQYNQVIIKNLYLNQLKVEHIYHYLKLLVKEGKQKKVELSLKIVKTILHKPLLNLLNKNFLSIEYKFQNMMIKKIVGYVLVIILMKTLIFLEIILMNPINLILLVYVLMIHNLIAMIQVQLKKKVICLIKILLLVPVLMYFYQII